MILDTQGVKWSKQNHGKEPPLIFWFHACNNIMTINDYKYYNLMKINLKLCNQTIYIGFYKNKALELSLDLNIKA